MRRRLFRKASRRGVKSCFQGKSDINAIIFSFFFRNETFFFLSITNGIYAIQSRSFSYVKAPRTPSLKLNFITNNKRWWLFCCCLLLFTLRAHSFCSVFFCLFIFFRTARLQGCAIIYHSINTHSPWIMKRTDNQWKMHLCWGTFSTSSRATRRENKIENPYQSAQYIALLCIFLVCLFAQ